VRDHCNYDIHTNHGDRIRKILSRSSEVNFGLRMKLEVIFRKAQ
jgi:hypothetical protein